jgi:aryl-alcohol dehydrogenase-like predicted oxidoreductase
LIGVSNVSVDQLRRAQSAAKIASVQNEFNRGLVISEDVLEACEIERVAFIPWNPLGVGLGDPVDTLRWLLRRSQVMLPIPGTSSVAHLETNLQAADDFVT